MAVKTRWVFVAAWMATAACKSNSATPDSIHAGSDSAAIDAPSCMTASMVLTQAAAAVLVVGDHSASMATGSKLATMDQAIVAALDHDAFDNLSVGVQIYPVSNIAEPACLEGLAPQGIACGVEATPLVAIAADTTAKSAAATGVRHAIATALTANAAPLDPDDDSSPIYDSLHSAIANLLDDPSARRALILITDGGFDCASVSSPTRPGISDGLCPDYEYPTTINSMLAQASSSATPVTTSVIGVPGSDSTGQDQGEFSTPPYSMLLALSTMAVAGNPANVPAGCTSTAVWTQTGAAPAVPCHFDLSSSASFSVATMTQAIADARTAAIGCVYDRPGGSDLLDSGGVVKLTLDGVVSTVAASSGSTCASAGCYDADATTVTIRGAACASIGRANAATIELACN